MLPYEETIQNVLGDFAYTPSTGCTDVEIIEIITSSPNTNYNITLENGALAISATPLAISVGTRIINEGDPVPANFDTTVTGLVCNDPAPVFTSFVVKNLIGTVVSGILAPGEYSVSADISNLQGYENYDITLQPGKLFVSPIVGCNKRIKASDICKSPASLSGFPQITTKLRFEYTNSLNVPIFIEKGSKNLLKGNAFFVGNVPEVFLPGVHTFEIYTDGRRLQWEVITNGCSSPSKSANGSNANPCGTSLSFDMSSIEESLTTSTISNAVYPNPVSNYVTLKLKENNHSTGLSVFNESGQFLFKRDISPSEGLDIEIDLSSFNKGLYFFRVTSNNETNYIRVLKN
jgi:hypothetical protein